MGLGSESFLGLYELEIPGVCIIFVSAWTITIRIYWLKACWIMASSWYQQGSGNRTSGGDQLYFNDPDGILVQLAQHGYLGYFIRPAASAIFARSAKRSQGCHKGF